MIYLVRLDHTHDASGITFVISDIDNRAIGARIV